MELKTLAVASLLILQGTVLLTLTIIVASHLVTRLTLIAIGSIPSPLRNRQAQRALPLPTKLRAWGRVLLPHSVQLLGYYMILTMTVSTMPASTKDALLARNFAALIGQPADSAALLLLTGVLAIASAYLVWQASTRMLGMSLRDEILDSRMTPTA